MEKQVRSFGSLIRSLMFEKYPKTICVKHCGLVIYSGYAQTFSEHIALISLSALAESVKSVREYINCLEIEI